MAFTLVISDDQVEKSINDINEKIFTSLDFARAYKAIYTEDWTTLVKRYGNIGDSDRYTILDYLSNRLEYYSQKQESLLKMIPRFSGEKNIFFREPTEDEKQYFDTPKIMVFHKL